MLTGNTGLDNYPLLNTDQDRNNSHGADKSFVYKVHSPNFENALA